jgi:CRP-like cAMP-binding protein
VAGPLADQRAREATARSFRLAATQVEAAEELGTARVVLVQILRRLREDGVFEVPRRGQYIIRDRARLAQMVAS